MSYSLHRTDLVRTGRCDYASPLASSILTLFASHVCALLWLARSLHRTRHKEAIFDMNDVALTMTSMSVLAASNFTLNKRFTSQL